MIVLMDKYVNDYWFKDNIVDCSKNVGVNNQNQIPVIISETEIEYMDINSEEKLNNNYENNKQYIYNEQQSRKYNSNSRINISNISTKNTKYEYRHNANRQIISDNGIINKKKSYKHNKLFNESYQNNNKRQMYNMHKTSNVHEYKTRRQKVLLGS
jgi:hypothetical protein